METPPFFDEDSWDEASVHDEGDVVAGRYELLTPIGAGGMGVVWRATDRTLRRDIALKLVRADRSHPLLGKRLLTEARAAAAVSHPCVVDIIDLGTTDDDDTYLVMELLEGRELDEQLDYGPLEPEAAVAIVAALADALAEAHRAGVVHRDIKASNVLMAQRPEGGLRPVLIDFGIARLVEASNDVRLTMTGNLLGTPTYMSPEQAAGSKSVDHRTDLWSLTVLLYELVTGAPPFEGDSYNEVLKKILMDEPPPLGFDDQALWAILSRGLHKDVEGRWQNAVQMRDALDAWLLAHGIEEDATGRALTLATEPSPTTTVAAAPPPARAKPLDSIEPTVLGLPRTTGDAPRREPRPTLTATLSTRSIVAMASALAAAALAVITTRAPAADHGVQATLSSASQRVAAAITVDGSSTAGRASTAITTAMTPAATQPSPAAAPTTSAEVSRPAAARPRATSTPRPKPLPKRSHTPLGLPLPSRPNF